MALHKQELLQQSSPRIIIDLHSWQLSGAAKLVHLAQGPFKEGILGDSMDLEKTLAAIAACEVLLTEIKGAFNLVIIIKACVLQ